MTSILVVIWFCLACGSLVHGQSITNGVAMAPPGKWVNSVEESPEASSGNSGDEGESYLLVDEQTHAGRGEIYTHIVKKITNQTGVQNGAKVAISFDPTYQQIDLHFIVLRRGADTYDRLEPGKIKVFQQETELERHLYNGTVSVVLFLEDVRVGDIIEYAWTLRGSNPVMSGRFLHSIQVDWTVPMQKQVYRLLWPVERKLTVTPHRTNIRPEIKHLQGFDEYTWDIKDRPALNIEEATPLGYSPIGWIQLTEFSNWKEVVDWALPLYNSTKPLPNELLQKIASWRLLNDQSDQVQSVLRFVQDEVRYLGMEMGASSHQPSDPAVVFARRFGDCKDKVTLFCAILRALGIEAHPVLVHTYNRKLLDGWAPSPRAFNHVVAQVKLNGGTFWVDPTRSFQRGQLKDFYFPDYARGLIVDAGTTNLCIIPPPKTGLPKTTVHEHFEITSYNLPIKYDIVTTLEGYSAEVMRAIFAESRREGLEKDYLNQSAKRYPKIKIAQPLEVSDDQQRNIFTLSEHYELRDLFELSEDKNKWVAWFFPDLILPLAKRPETSFRSMPLGIAYPCHYVQETDVWLPQEHKIQNSTKTVQDKALRFERQVNYNKRFLSLRYELETLTNEVPPKDVPEHLENLKKIRELASFGIQHPNGAIAKSQANEPLQINWPILFMALIYAVLMVVVAVFAYHFRPRYRSDEPPLVYHGLKGIGGWLIVLAIVICIMPTVRALWMYRNCIIFSQTSWNYITTPGTEVYHPLRAPMLIYELLAFTTLQVFSLLNLVLFFQKRFAFQRFFLIFLALNLTIIVIDHVGCGFLPQTQEKAVPSQSMFTIFLFTTTWASYILKSQRVKLTFVE